MKKSLFAAALLSLALAACGGEKAAEAPASEAKLQGIMESIYTAASEAAASEAPASEAAK